VSARIRLAVGVLVLVAVACGPPITVKRAPPRTVTAELARSALNSNKESLFSENVLYRWNLTQQYEEDPEGALGFLHGKVARGEGGRAALFALAELSFERGDRTRQREWYLASAVYAYTFLFPGTGAGPEELPGELDPRSRIAGDLYNRGLTEGFASPDGSQVLLQAGVYPLPFGQQLVVHFDPAQLQWSGRTLFDFVPVAELKVSGLGARYRRTGIGAPLAAKAWMSDPGQVENDYVAPNVKVPVTALLRIDEPRRQLDRQQIDASFELYDGFERGTVDIDGRAVPLESEPSAALAYMLSRSKVWEWEIWGFLFGDLLGKERTTLAFSQPHRPGRIPVVFVHGTASSPGRWADMLNVLSNDSSLRGRYEYWFFFYETENPIPYSAMRLREALEQAVHRLDPDGKDPALRQMVVIGHSQGGLLTKMTAIDSGSQLWDAFSRKPIESLNVSSETRQLLQRAMFVKPLPFVTRVIFISTPHRGAYAAGWRIAQWVARFARLPLTLASATTDLLKGNPDAIRLDPERPHMGAVYGMTPGSAFLKALAPIPIAPGVAAHSIIPIKGDPPPQGQGDGVVKYDSAHIEGVESEFVVPRWYHSAQNNPLAIEEVRRILLEHAQKTCATVHVGCQGERALPTAPGSTGPPARVTPRRGSRAPRRPAQSQP
jgi:pimeloyl-ACP methyl ester carboxylesterase